MSQEVLCLVNVKKRGGATQAFDQTKVRMSLVRAGAKEENAAKVAQTIATRVREGIETAEIKTMAASELRPINPEAARTYETFTKR